MRNKAHKSALGPVVNMDQKRKSALIEKLNMQIQSIIEELSKLQRDKEEDSMVRLSDLTQQRDRLMERLAELTLDDVDEGKLSKDFDEGVGKQFVLENGGANMKVNIVNENVVDPSKGEISPFSPLGKEIVNKKEGETVEVRTPAGLMQYKILQIR